MFKNALLLMILLFPFVTNAKYIKEDDALLIVIDKIGSETVTNMTHIPTVKQCQTISKLILDSKRKLLSDHGPATMVVCTPLFINPQF